MMEILMNPITQIGGAIVLALAVYVRYLLQKNKKTKKIRQRSTSDTQAGTEDRDSKDSVLEEHNCLVVEGWSYGTEYINSADLKKIAKREAGIGRQWRYGLLNVYWLEKDEKGKYTPIIPSETLKHPPAELWEALQQEETEIVFDMAKDENALEKYGPFLAVFAISFLALIIAVAKGG